MKNIILVLFLTLIYTTYISGQKNTWPYCDVDHAKAYLYNLESLEGSNYQIIKENKLSETATSDGIRLLKEQSEKILSIVNSDIKGLISGLSKTIIPHHAIVFFNSNGLAVASIMISFDGEGIILSPVKKGNQQIIELSQNEVEIQQSKLSEFRVIFEKLGLPVLKSPDEYQKLNQRMKVEILELLNHNPIKQLNSEDAARFDLSGLVLYRGKILAIADKEWNNHIYQIDTLVQSFTTSIFQDLPTKENFDIEGLEYFNNRFYLIDEFGSEVYTAEPGKSSLTELEIPWKNFNINVSTWGNKGFEGIAIDSANQVLYLAKEREERNLFSIDLKTLNISEPFIKQLNEGGGHDISELKFENGCLYYLERGLGQLSRINIKTGEKKSVSFHEIDYNNGQRLFKNNNPQFGMAEAFILTPDEIWIGFDNNGDPVSDYGKSLGLKEGNKTAIIIFKRPGGF